VEEPGDNLTSLKRQDNEPRASCGCVVSLAV
jgi:hypothetical protein